MHALDPVYIDRALTGAKKTWGGVPQGGEASWRGFVRFSKDRRRAPAPSRRRGKSALGRTTSGTSNGNVLGRSRDAAMEAFALALGHWMGQEEPVRRLRAEVAGWH